MTELVDAQFYASLKTTLVPTNGAGTPTFTRATTKNIFDNEGKLISVKSGSCALGGARCAQNWVREVATPVTSSQDFSNVTKYNCNLTYASGIVRHEVTNNVSLFRFFVGATANFTGLGVGARIYMSLWARGVAGSVGKKVYIATHSDGDILPQNTSKITLTSDWQQMSFLRTAKTVDGDEYCYCAVLYDEHSNVPIGEFVEFKDMQISPYQCEYITSGVLSPPYHGGGADGVKYFDTDSSGNAIPDATILGAHIDPESKTNNLLWCRDLTVTGVSFSKFWQCAENIGSNIVVNGGFDTDTEWTKGSGWSISGGVAIATAATGKLTSTTSVPSNVSGDLYNATITISNRTAGHIYVRIGELNGGNSYVVQNSGTYTFTFKSNAGTQLGIETAANFNGQIDNFSIYKAAIAVSKTQTGIDAVANSCSLLTASAANATILQTITAASTPACSGFWVKRSVGTGSIFFTRNGGVDWLDITSLINASTFTCVKIENTSVTNPQVGFKIATSGDAIIVDAGLNHAGTTLTLPILTTTAAVTRAADVLTYQTASNFSDTAGTILATYKPTHDTYASGSIVGSTTRGLYSSASNSGVQALDGTNTINGPTGTPSGQIKIGARWSGSSLQCFALDSFGSSGSYDGSFNLSTIGILPGASGYIRDLAIWQSSLTDVEIRSAYNLNTSNVACLNQLYKMHKSRRR